MVTAIGPYSTREEALMAGQDEAVRQNDVGNNVRNLYTAPNELDPTLFDAVIEYDDYSEAEEAYEPPPTVKASPPYGLIVVGILAGGALLGGVLYFSSKKGKRS